MPFGAHKSVTRAETRQLWKQKLLWTVSWDQSALAESILEIVGDLNAQAFITIFLYFKRSHQDHLGGRFGSRAFGTAGLSFSMPALSLSHSASWNLPEDPSLESLRANLQASRIWATWDWPEEWPGALCHVLQLLAVDVE